VHSGQDSVGRRRTKEKDEGEGQLVFLESDQEKYNLNNGAGEIFAN
jgi:hypothetical protein